MNQSSPVDYKVYKISSDENKECVFVLSHLSADEKHWPAFIQYEGIEYTFDSTESMDSWMIGSYSGHARYVRAYL